MTNQTKATRHPEAHRLEGANAMITHHLFIALDLAAMHAVSAIDLLADRLHNSPESMRLREPKDQAANALRGANEALISIVKAKEEESDAFSLVSAIADLNYARSNVDELRRTVAVWSKSVTPTAEHALRYVIRAHDLAKETQRSLNF